ncbi:hypothetical protein N7481_007143 [Penicillium waksmanii]|uniref:uncharacterized protein n=1 Tax=Penicillium waksmanii TaxID=69791 RepID=UPI002549B2CD|nr:uncharacterized protein N7481_007143 [Penicillium waksmanii]KAJ5979845.1 hypothetical protein N7481_007143 [Penicillium waksmanii]
MKFSLPFCLALVTYITPALADGVAAEVNIKYIDGGEDPISILPDTGCYDTDYPTTSVRSIDVSQLGDDRPKCIFYTEPGCQGDDWTIEVPKTAEDGKKTQRFSRPFYVASLECFKAE